MPAALARIFLSLTLVLILLSIHSRPARAATGPVYLPMVIGGLGSLPTNPITDEQRAASLSAIKQRYDLIRVKNDPTSRLAAANDIRRIPHIAYAGISENGTIWAQFTDGRDVTIPIERDTSATPDRRHVSRTSSIQPLHVGLPKTDLVGKEKAFVLNAMGTCFKSPEAPITRWLTDAGYDVYTGTGTLEELKTVVDTSVLYMDAHGGLGRRVLSGTLVSAFRIWSGTPYSIQNDLTYLGDFVAGRLSYMLAGHNRDASGNCQSEYHYAITGGFVQAYMSFADHSLVFFNACDTAAAGATPFQQDLGQKGATMYIGWDTPVDDQLANAGAMYLMDRLSGANEYLPENPKQRPFDIGSVYEEQINYFYDTESRCLVRPITALPVGCATPSYTETFMLIKPLIPMPTIQFRFLRPNIAFAEPLTLNGSVAEPDLRLHGDFGTIPGKVTIGGSVVSITQWTSTTVTVNWPSTGPGSVGNIVVTVRGHTSNAVPLSSWQGIFSWTERYRDVVNGIDGFGANVSCLVEFRGDVHAFREAPAKNPITLPTAWMVNTSASRCTWFMSGNAAVPVEIPGAGTHMLLYQLSGSGSIAQLPASNEGRLSPTSQMSLSANPNNLLLPIVPLRDAASTGLLGKLTVTDLTAGNTQEQPWSLRGIEQAPAQLGADFSIQAADFLVVDTPLLEVRVSWGMIPVTNSPVDAVVLH